jgi:hypothetical protein
MKKYLKTYIMLSFACWLVHPTIVDVFVGGKQIGISHYFDISPIMKSLMLGLVFTIIFSFISIRR